MFATTQESSPPPRSMPTPRRKPALEIVIADEPAARAI
jgi:hypothetical protein